MTLIGYTEDGLKILRTDPDIYEVSLSDNLAASICGGWEGEVPTVEMYVSVGQQIALYDNVGSCSSAGDFDVDSPLSGEVVAVRNAFVKNPDWSEDEAQEAWREFLGSDASTYEGWLFRVRVNGSLPEFRETEPDYNDLQ